MTPSREPIAPPELTGYRHLDRLGSGGFAEVFLYEREFPRQEVAIKVLDRVVGSDAGHDRFIAEANAMASVSSHPYIVTIFHADLAANGHPYLVMEYYPGANYSVRSKSTRFSVAEVLRLGVQVSSAVETAHRAGILHRDIKPANILTSAYGRPGLTDFGISASRESTAAEAEGLSIPWSPPEALGGDGASDERSDLYSLAATLYTVLEGRSPFERVGDRNRSIDLIDRIEREPLPQFSRLDVPDSFYRLMAQAMAKDPSVRPFSAAEFARALQTIEAEQRFDITPLELSDTGTAPVETQAIDADAGSTRVKSPTVVRGQRRFTVSGDTVVRQDLPERPAAPAAAAPIRGVPFAIPAPDRPASPLTSPLPQQVVRRPASASYAPDPVAPTVRAPNSPTRLDPTWTKAARRRRRTYIVVGVTVLVIAGVVGLLVTGSSGPPSPVIASWTVHGTTGNLAIDGTGYKEGDLFQMTVGSGLQQSSNDKCKLGQNQVFNCVLAVDPHGSADISVVRVRNVTPSPAATANPTLNPGS
jgi:serine/threonine protein kinase